MKLIFFLSITICFLSLGCNSLHENMTSIDSKIRTTVIRKFLESDSSLFDDRQRCFFKTYVQEDMDSMSVSYGRYYRDIKIQSRFLDYVGFGFDIITKNDSIFYYGFSDIYSIEHATNLDTIIFYKNSQLKTLSLRHLGLSRRQSKDMSDLIYNLYFENRNNREAPLFESYTVSIEDLVFELKDKKNIYHTYAESLLGKTVIIFELKHAGYLVFDLSRSDEENFIKEIFIPNLGRPRQMNTDAIPDKYLSKCG